MDLNTFLEEKGFGGIALEPGGGLLKFDRGGDKNGWAVAYQFEKNGDPWIYAMAGDFKTDERHIFKTSEIGDDKELRERVKKATKEADEYKKKTQEAASKLAQRFWSEATDTADSEYLKHKLQQSGLVPVLKLRTEPTSFGTHRLIVPCQDINGKIWGLQKISDDGQKTFMSGQRCSGVFFTLGEITNETDRLFIAEGIATAASIYLATEKPTICAFNASNLEKVAKAFREKYPKLPIIVAGDDDRFTKRGNEPYNTGRIAAEKAAATCAGVAVFPDFSAENTTNNKATDFNDLAQLEGIEKVRETLQRVRPPNPEDFIKTQSTGFHTIKETQRGITKKPCYEDLAKYFSKVHQYKLLNGSEICYAWNGAYYEVFGDTYIENFAQRHFDPFADNKMVVEFRNLILRTNLMQPHWFDSTTMNKTNFKNGVLDNETLEFSPHSPDRGFRYILGYDYDPQAACPTFDKFMKEVTSGDEELEKILLEFAGYALSSDECWIHKALVLEGQGSNGKSTYMTVLRFLAGKDNYTPFTLSDLKKEGNRQCLDGKLFNMAEETPSRSLMETSMFKNLVGGGESYVRQLYKNPYTMRNRAKLIFACNELPMTEDTSHGYMRRFLIVPFKALFTDEKGNKDPLIEEKLKSELAGIWNKVYAAYRGVKKRGQFSTSKSSSIALEDYKKEIDPTIDWVDRNLQIHPLGNGKDETFVLISKIYTDYQGDMERSGIKPVNSIVFGRRLSRHLPDYEKRKHRKKIENRAEQILIAVTQGYEGE